ncbi:hypothetical protein CMQ_2180 [Grosmannia clavigera kw1407]|uniref:Uncharacterized protein n=1 Tax=Grosmannia clavigera (strain kw1407 / UAMH 11150) TaxID=655863 RepID=F0XJI5_GROCL|nr:uncharacterized protein CMQ_2180 [Grosmannia clavigera kw1407]EFX02131.1 hypothetical protein CMQ_2180 [Grosmannia clavigera kw1407]
MVWRYAQLITFVHTNGIFSLGQLVTFLVDLQRLEIVYVDTHALLLQLCFALLCKQKSQRCCRTPMTLGGQPLPLESASSLCHDSGADSSTSTISRCLNQGVALVAGTLFTANGLDHDRNLPSSELLITNMPSLGGMIV